MANKIEFKILGDVKDLEKNMKSAGSTLTTFGKNLTKFVTLPIGIAGVAFTKLASDAEETKNKFDVVFKGMGSTASDWAESFGNDVGRSTEEMQRFSSGIGDVLKPLGFATEEAFELSKNMTKLALDVASFNNRSDPDVIRAFTSALTGERESLKTLGIVINEADVKQEALNLGLVRAGQELTKTAKAQATYSLLLKNTEDAQGDLARTQDSFANKLKRLKADFQEVGVELGTILLPAATRFVGVLSTLLTTITKLDQNTQNFLVTASGLLFILGPTLQLVGGLIKGYGLLAGNIALVSSSLTIVAGLGATAFIGWKIGSVIAEMESVKRLLDDLAFKLDIYGLRTNKLSLQEADALNRQAVERKKAFDAANADKIKQLEEDKSSQLAHEQEIQALKQATQDFIKANDDELKDLSNVKNQEELDNLFLKWEQERDGLLNHLNLKLQLLEAAGITEGQQVEIIEKQKQEIKDKYAKLDEQKDKKIIQNKKFTNKELLDVAKEGLANASSLSRSAARTLQSIELVQAAIQGKGAIMKAWNSAPFPANLPAVALTTASTGALLASMASQTFAVGTPNIPYDMQATVHKGETIIPSTFAEGIRSGELSLSGGNNGGGGGGLTLSFAGAQFIGVTEDIVEQIFTKASEMTKNRTLISGVA